MADDADNVVPFRPSWIRATRTDVQRVGEYLGSLAMNEMSGLNCDFADVFAALDEARSFVEERQLHDRALRLLGPRYPEDEGPDAA